MAKITYIPLDPGDPSTTVWNGLVFKANVPNEIDGSHYFDAEMIERARGNPWFSVDGDPPYKRAVPTVGVVPPPGVDAVLDELGQRAVAVYPLPVGRPHREAKERIDGQ